jgi:MFS family permease
MSSQSISPSMFDPLRSRDFRLLFAGMVVGQAMLPLQFVSQIFWVQTHAPDDIKIILVGIIGSTRGFGMLTFGLYGGALADRFDRRKLLMVTQAGALVLNLSIALLMALSPGDTLGLLVFFTLTFFSAAMYSVDAPTRQAITPELLGPRMAPAGISLNTAGMQVAMPVSIFLSGVLVDELGFAATFALSAAGHAVEIITLALMRYRSAFARKAGAAAHGIRSTLADVREGIAYTRRNRTIFWIIALPISMMALGFPATANLGPTFITTVVVPGEPYRVFGFIAITWGVGAFIASMTLTRFSLFERKGMLEAFGALIFATGFLIFSIGEVPTAVLGNLGLGIGMATTQVCSAALIQHMVPNDMRGRVMSLLLLNMGVAQLMTLPIAVIAQSVSLETLFPVLALIVLGIVVLILATQPRIWQARIRRVDIGLPPVATSAAAPAVPVEAP